MTILEMMGVPQESFGDGTGNLPRLTVLTDTAVRVTREPAGTECGGATPPHSGVPSLTGASWRWWTVAVATLMALSTIAVAQAQDNPYPIFTVGHLATTMDTMGPNFEAARRALGDEDYAFAKERFIRAREQLAITITFLAPERSRRRRPVGP